MNFFKNLSNNNEGQDNQTVIEEKKSEIDDLAVETKALESLILEKDEEITELNQEVLPVFYSNNELFHKSERKSLKK